MTVVGVSMVLNEIDIVKYTVKRMLEQVDELIFIDNGSTDGTRELLAEYPVRVVDDPIPGHRWSECITRESYNAMERGASWIVPFDTDEIWTTTGGRLADMLTEYPLDVISVYIRDHVLTPLDPESEDPMVRMGWRREPSQFRRIAFRPKDTFVVLCGGHTVQYRDEPPTVGFGGYGGDFSDRAAVHHFPVRSLEQFALKAKRSGEAFRDPNRIEGDSTHWLRYDRALQEGHLAELFNEEFLVDPNTDNTIIYDPAV